MKIIFQFLYDIHPLLPLIYLFIFGLGVIGPAVYCGVRKIPYSIGLIFQNSKNGDGWAKLIIFIYGLLVSSTLTILFFQFIVN